MSTPMIPPRPVQSKHHEHEPASSTLDAPRVPPRPQRRIERSLSPNRESFARSPLNESPFATNHGSTSGNFYDTQNDSNSNLKVPQRPPSVNLPSIGQEGNEYADIGYEKAEKAEEMVENTSTVPTQTRNVDSDLPLHAPKPGFPTSSAKARIFSVTRSESSQAAAIGIGKAATPIQADDRGPLTRSLKAKESFTRTESSASTERPESIHADDEHGIPEIGQRVPMYPNAGDVQAPSPSPSAQNFPSGIGFHNDGSQKPRHHGRTRSGKEVFAGPPGSYGLHGHGVANNDKFEKAWYDKHPEAILREGHGQYGPGINAGRGEWALSSDDLNKIVRSTASRGSGFGTSPDIVGLPNEQIGYMASDEYALRMASPRPQSAAYHNKAHSNHSQTHVESPLRKASFPVDTQETFDGSRESASSRRPPSEHALESEADEGGVIHIDPPTQRLSKVTGNGYDPPTEDVGGNTTAEGMWIEERGYGVPILASDEVAKEPGSEYLQPAVSPAQERRGSAYHAGIDSDVPLSYQSGYSHRSGSASSSRPGSRPGSVHGMQGLTRFTSHDDRDDMHTPLENVDEYEPLFPDDEDETTKHMAPADRFKQRRDAKRRFPSQDIWEDTPNSLQLQATVETPEPVEGQTKSKPTARPGFESPETEAARKGEVSEADKESLMSGEERLANMHFKPHIRDEIHQPGMKGRFPSRDIWEDSPDSARLETTVGSAQADETQSPPDAGLEAGAVVYTSGRPSHDQTVREQTRDRTTSEPATIEKPNIPPRPVKSKPFEELSSATSRSMPSVPARPVQKSRSIQSTNLPSPLSRDSAESSPTDPRKAPAIPDKPRPQIPARPSKPVKRESSEDVPLSKTTSATSRGSNENTASRGVASPPPAPKPKPVLPARSAGGKIAALKAGFLSDLDKRLQLGPQAPPKAQDTSIDEDKEEKKTPLVDARKGRAKGPVRRKPAGSPAAAETKLTGFEFAIVEPWTVWQTSPDGNINTAHPPNATLSRKTAKGPATVDQLPPTGTHTAGDALYPISDHATQRIQSLEKSTQETTPMQPSIDPVEQRINASVTDDVEDAIIPAASATAKDPAHITDKENPTTPTSRAAVHDEKSIEFDSTSGSPIKITAHVGGSVHQKGTVIAKEGEAELPTKMDDEV